MFGIFRRLRALEAKVEQLDREVGTGEYERMRSSVLNALRALNREKQAQEARETDPVSDHQPGVDRVSQAILARRKGLRGS